MNPRIAGEPGAQWRTLRSKWATWRSKGISLLRNYGRRGNVVDVQKGEIGIGLPRKASSGSLKDGWYG